MGERIAKFLASLGHGSRRNIEKMIFDQRVKVNNEILKSPSFNVDGNEEISIDEVKIPTIRPETRLWIYYKPKGLVVSHKDNENRKTVFENLPKTLPKNLISVGRLDLASEGLLLLTNSSVISRYLEMSSVQRKYKVRIFGNVLNEKEKLEDLRNGITIDGINYKPIIANIINEENSNGCIDNKENGKERYLFNNNTEMSNKNSKNENIWVSFTLTEGKNREIRRIVNYFNWQVNRLIRTDYGMFNLNYDNNNLVKPGDVVEVNKNDVNSLLNIIKSN